MPETIMPLLTGMFLVLAGTLIGYFLWYRDRSPDDATRLQLSHENEELSNELKKSRNERKTLAGELSNYNGKLHILQELCDDLVTEREQSHLDRVSLEADICSYRNRLDEAQSELGSEKHLRTAAETRRHEDQKSNHEQQGLVDEEWLHKLARVETNLLHRTNDIKQLTGISERMLETAQASESKRVELESELATQTSLLDAARQKDNGREQEQRSLEQSLENSNDRIRQLMAERDSSNASREEHDNTITALRARLENQEQTIGQLREKSDDFASKMRNEEASRSEIESSSKDIQCQMQSQMHELRIQIEQHERDRNELTARIFEMEIASKHETRLLEQRTREASKLNRACEQLATRIAAMEKSQMRDVKRQDSRDAEWAQLTSERDDLVTELARIRDHHADGLRLVELRGIEIEQIRTARDVLVSQLEASREKYSAGFIKLESAVSENATLLLEREEMQERLGSLKEYYSRGSSLLEQRIVEIGSLRRERDELSARLSQAEIECSQSDERVRNQNDDVKTRINGLISQRDGAYSDLDKLKSEFDTLRNEFEQAKHGQDPAVLLPFGEQVDTEYGGRTMQHATRGTVFVRAPDISDDLKLISGIADVLEQRLNEYGVFTFKQIMHWEEKTVQEFSTLLTFKDRIDRDDWIGQAARFYFEKHRKAA